MNPPVTVIDSQNRLRISLDWIEVLKWRGCWSNGSDLWFRVGPEQQLEVVPEKTVQEERGRLEKLISRNSGEKKQRLIRMRESYDQFAWSLTPSIEKTRITITIPKELRKLDLAPAPSESAAIYVDENRFEIWKRDSLVDHLKKMASEILNHSDILMELAD